MKIQIKSGSNVPVYRQIMEQIKLCVMNGTLKTGDQLASVRKLAEQLRVNANTVAKAYSGLTNDGIIESKQGKGVFICEPRNIYSDEERQRRLDEAIEHFLSVISTLNFSKQEVLAELNKTMAFDDKKQRNVENQLNSGNDNSKASNEKNNE